MKIHLKMSSGMWWQFCPGGGWVKEIEKEQDQAYAIHNSNGC